MDLGLWGLWIWAYGSGPMNRDPRAHAPGPTQDLTRAAASARSGACEECALRRRQRQCALPLMKQATAHMEAVCASC